ncbi:MAG: flagellar motor protein MotB, partial [Pseudomonadota bacterium]
GRMVVVLPSDVLFKSGSSRLSKKGNETIDKVAKLLVSIPEKQFQVEGHTDNVPIRSAKFPSNWELASARALNVVNLMVKAGMPEQRISAASFADTKPVASNDTKEGKSANRRIDIVVIPDLSKLPGYQELNRMSNTQ